LVCNSSIACCSELWACWIWPSAAARSDFATTVEASISVIWRRAVSSAASCLELSSRKIGSPFFTSSLTPT
jgi:hypothetical protein